MPLVKLVTGHRIVRDDHVVTLSYRPLVSVIFVFIVISFCVCQIRHFTTSISFLFAFPSFDILFHAISTFDLLFFDNLMLLYFTLSTFSRSVFLPRYLYLSIKLGYLAFYLYFWRTETISYLKRISNDYVIEGMCFRSSDLSSSL